MKILDKLPKEAILCDLKAKDKKGIIEELAAPLAKIAESSINEVVQVLLERESLGSTGIGGGIGIPHGKMKQFDDLVLGFGISRAGVDFDSFDKKPTHLFFVLITPEDSVSMHLSMLAKISRLLKNDWFKESLMAAKNPDEVSDIISQVDEEF